MLTIRYILKQKNGIWCIKLKKSISYGPMVRDNGCKRVGQKVQCVGHDESTSEVHLNGRNARKIRSTRVKYPRTSRRKLESIKKWIDKKLSINHLAIYTLMPSLFMSDAMWLCFTLFFAFNYIRLHLLKKIFILNK